MQRWLLVEQPGPWGRDAVAESQLDRDVAGRLAAAARGHAVRVVLLRRVGWRAGPGRSAFLARTAPAGGWIERLDVDDPRRLLAVDLSVLARDAAPGLGDPRPGGLHLVCTNGRHDRCCADLGRPVARALDEAGTPGVWECSHIGGDRFAANVVCLPSGVYLGRVPPERAAAMVEELSRGWLDLDHYRGRSCYPPLAQAAEIFVRQELGERRLDALRPVSTIPRGADRLTVEVAGAGGVRAEATVARVRAEPAGLTCGAAASSAPWDYRLERLEFTGRSVGEP